MHYYYFKANKNFINELKSLFEIRLYAAFPFKNFSSDTAI